MQTNLKFIVRDKDRHGTVRLYYRRDGKKTRLRGPEGSADFLEDYRSALLGEPTKPMVETQSHAIVSGSFRELCLAYFASADFKLLEPRGQRVRRGILERFCINKNDGDKPYAALEPQHLRLRRDAMMDRPEAANNMLKAVRQVYKYAMIYQGFSHNPAIGVPYLPGNPDGFHAWTTDEVAQFEKHHPVGSRARLAMALALFTGQRRADLVELGPPKVKAIHGVEWLTFTQVKNRRKKPVHLEIPLILELRGIIDATETGKTAFLTTKYGKPFTSNGFGNKFREWCDEAGLPQCSAHGLRKAAASRLAELGCTEQEIMSTTGHKTSKEIARYTKAARQKTRAESALSKMSKSIRP
jgi:integrase